MHAPPCGSLVIPYDCCELLSIFCCCWDMCYIVAYFLPSPHANSLVQPMCDTNVAVLRKNERKNEQITNQLPLLCLSRLQPSSRPHRVQRYSYLDSRQRARFRVFKFFILLVSFDGWPWISKNVQE